MPVTRYLPKKMWTRGSGVDDGKIHTNKRIPLLSGESGRQLYIPHGCAHGILVLSDEAVFAYRADDVYHPEDEAAIAWDDPDLAIEWPLPRSEVLTSPKDAANPSFKDAFAKVFTGRER